MDIPEMVIDTTIFIENYRKTDKSNSILYNLPMNTKLFVSSITIFELEQGATDKEKKEWLTGILKFCTILEFGKFEALKAAEIYNQLKKKNQLIEFRDIFIAATAINLNLPLKTLNINHFNRIENLQLA